MANEQIIGIQSLLSKLLVADLTLSVLIDSGAAISVIRKSVFDRIRASFPRLVLEDSDTEAAAINGSNLKFLGVSRLPCRWLSDGPQFHFKFFVTRDLSVPCVVGIDLLQAQKCAVDFHLGLLDVGYAVLECVSPVAELLETEHRILASVPVFVKRQVVVPAFSEALVPSNVSNHDCRPGSSKRKIVGLVEPETGFTSLHSVLVASALVTLNDDVLFTRVLNPTATPLTLYPKQKIAYFSQYREPYGISASSKVASPSTSDLSLLFASDLSTLNRNQQERVYDLLNRFKPVFSRDKWDLGSCDRHKLRIELTEGARPSRVPYRSMNPSKRQSLKEHIDNLKAHDLITPTHSEWAAPTVLVPKRDGSYRLVIDYRKLNAQTIKTSWPLPRISDILQNLSGSCFFSSLDLCSGFHQMEIEEEDQHLTSFITPFGLYQWKRMPMGLCNAPGAFQRLMEIVLSGLTYEMVLVYLDDIIVFGTNFDEHLERLQCVLQRILDANLKISPSKCRLFQTKLTFLGHVVSADGVETDPSKVKAVENYPVPQTVKQLRAFLGLVGFYRKFISEFGSIAEPLFKLMNKGEKFEWNNRCQTAFIQLKDALLKAPILGFPNEKDMFELCTDASLTGIGAVLSQLQVSGKKVIAYASKSLQKSQRNYSATKRELFAVIFFTS